MVAAHTAVAANTADRATMRDSQKMSRKDALVHQVKAAVALHTRMSAQNNKQASASDSPANSEFIGEPSSCGNCSNQGTASANGALSDSVERDLEQDGPMDLTLEDLPEGTRHKVKLLSQISPGISVLTCYSVLGSCEGNVDNATAYLGDVARPHLSGKIKSLEPLGLRTSAPQTTERNFHDISENKVLSFDVDMVSHNRYSTYTDRSTRRFPNNLKQASTPFRRAESMKNDSKDVVGNGSDNVSDEHMSNSSQASEEE